MRLRTLATSAAVAASLILAPVANAQTLGDLDKLASQAIATADCRVLKTTLDTVGRATGNQLIGPETTRNQLARNLQALNGTPRLDMLGLAVIKYSGTAADRALACNLVKPDPTVPGLAQLSSLLNDYAPTLSS